MLKHLTTTTVIVKLSQGVSIQLERTPNGNGILTVFPFTNFFLRVRLGPTNPTQISFKWEPLFLRRSEFSPDLIATPSRIFFAARSTPSHDDASTLAACLPITLSKKESTISVADLAPSILLTRKTPSEFIRLARFQRLGLRWVRYYALFLQLTRHS